MYGFLLNTPNPYEIDPNLSGRLSFATSTLLRGMATVFAVLCIIWLFLVLLRVFIHDLPMKRKAKMQATVAATKEAAPAADLPAPAPQQDAELIAAITTAIAAYTADEGDISFRVVSFHRVNQ